MQSVPYAPTIASLMYVMVATRPDISHAVGVVSRFMHNPGRSHWNTVKHVFRYLAGTKDHNILFGLNPTSGVVVYTDSDFIGCVDIQKSTIGYCFKFGNGAILWKSKLQECTTTFQQVDSDSAQTIYNDNQGVVALSKNLLHHNASKHIDV